MICIMANGGILESYSEMGSEESTLRLAIIPIFGDCEEMSGRERATKSESSYYTRSRMQLMVYGRCKMFVNTHYWREMRCCLAEA
jgi:hypothetical protein